jgi:hypothetical protein
VLQNSASFVHLIGGNTMIGYMTVGTKDLKKAGEFYDKVCGELGMGRPGPGRRLRRLPAP